MNEVWPAGGGLSRKRWEKYNNKNNKWWSLQRVNNIAASLTGRPAGDYREKVEKNFGQEIDHQEHKSTAHSEVVLFDNFLIYNPLQQEVDENFRNAE